MRQTPPSPSQNDNPPDHQSNGHAHGNGTVINPPPTAATATTEPSDDENDQTDETNGNGSEYRSSSPNDSPNSTPLTPSNLLNQQLRRGAAAPLGAESGSGNNDSNIFPTTESLFRHTVPSSADSPLPQIWMITGRELPTLLLLL
jgi:hypothetical protein